VADEADDLTASLNSPTTTWPEIVRRVRTRTPGRLLAGRAGAAYRTQTQLELRKAHAAARDAVRAELDMERDFGAAFIERWKLFEVSTKATNKEEYLLRPDLGRSFSEDSRAELVRHCSPGGHDLQVAIGDGLSVAAVSKQAPPLLELLDENIRQKGWRAGPLFVIRHCRVGILNEIGTLLAPRVVILLIGERPGLATAESLSAYMAYQPHKDHTDADRNLISNIHARGVSARDAALRIVGLAQKMMTTGTSGYELREELTLPVDARAPHARIP
jgi:ethanolamine ammonia-lyase small subunit